ncbi:NUDIX domain-containing protein [Egibacter rhizosphaerae]|uniref:NUDIX domain-containing protein n=1 Tax=Egibacter rhizosphaerae TaxID=1670831 RepID=A0A411YJ63_9ACTN|nr:NAD(P)H-hydrate epimerase [Egibacter rhizosphaerae]QBI21122.1 NUDIX domain-containing protein [Egibacter rhizosphaerae]
MTGGGDPQTARWERLREALGEANAREQAGSARVGATLALLAPRSRDRMGVIYTKRREDLRTHPGQISFPGGRVEPGESVGSAALREAREEIGLDPGTVTPLGATDAFYIPPSRFWLQTIVARWDAPHPLAPEQEEVAEILEVPVAQLLDPERWRVVRLSASGRSWAWQLDGGHVLWGATALVTVGLLDALEPGWRAGADPRSFGADREVLPWLAEASRAPDRKRLTGLPEVTWDELPARPVSRDGPDTPVDEVAEAVADVAVHLASRATGASEPRALVLAGGGANGAVARAAVAALERRGGSAMVLDVGHGESGPTGRAPAEAGGAGGAGVAAEGGGAGEAGEAPREVELPAADVVVDGLVGSGLRGPLREPARAVVLALRRQSAPVVAIDVPTGLDTARGLVGEVLAADATVVAGAPVGGLSEAGVGPFAGELVVARKDRPPARLALSAGTASPGWRE